MEEIEVVLERHAQRILTLERDVRDLKTVQAEIRSMHDTLVALTTELKHANEHLARHEQKIDEIKAIPGHRLQQIVTAIIAARLAGGTCHFAENSERYVPANCKIYTKSVAIRKRKC